MPPLAISYCFRAGCRCRQSFVSVAPSPSAFARLRAVWRRAQTSPLEEALESPPRPRRECWGNLATWSKRLVSRHRPRAISGRTALKSLTSPSHHSRGTATTWSKMLRDRRHAWAISSRTWPGSFEGESQRAVRGSCSRICQCCERGSSKAKRNAARPTQRETRCSRSARAGLFKGS